MKSTHVCPFLSNSRPSCISYSFQRKTVSSRHNDITSRQLNAWRLMSALNNRFWAGIQSNWLTSVVCSSTSWCTERRQFWSCDVETIERKISIIHLTYSIKRYFELNIVINWWEKRFRESNSVQWIIFVSFSGSWLSMECWTKVVFLLPAVVGFSCRLAVIL